MRLKGKIIYLSALLLIFAGCKDSFLEVPPQGQLTQDNFPATGEDALLATNAIYQVLRQSTYHRGFYPIDDIMSDDARKGSNPTDQASTLGPYDDFTFTPTNEFISNWWNTLYVGVKRANVVINKAPEINMDQGLKNQYIGEAKFMRALFYFDLVRAWGGVPLVTTVDPTIGMKRASEDEVYSLIESDLRDAAAKLKLRSALSPADLGRATRGAANALLSRTYLYEKVYDSAAYFAQKVIDSQEYGLEPNYEDANGINGEHGIESIFEVGGIGAEGGINAGNDEYAIGQGVRGIPNRGYGFNRPSLDLINSFEAGDPRMDATVIFLGETLDGITIVGDGNTPDETKDANGNLIEKETYNQKVWVPGTTVSSSQGCNRRLIRYAEVLLNAAEAYNEISQPGKALMYLNEVRKRAREGNTAILPDITTTDKASLEDKILEERRHEFAMEGFRFWDLVRTGKAAQVLGPLGYVEGKHNHLPIPQLEIDISQGTIKQNPNWN